jgi:GNAT superfamily N-acetyltransferase
MLAVMASLAAISVAATEALMRSDYHYFGLAAEVSEVERGVHFCRMAGFTHMPVGCLTVCDPGLSPSPEAVREIEEKTLALGAGLVRIYTSAAAPGNQKIAQLGYSPQLEIGFAGEPAGSPEDAPAVTLRPVRGVGDWEEKLSIQGAELSAPDGHLAAAADWVAMERLKCEEGSMSAFIIEHGDISVGAVCALEIGELLRMKNLVVGPSHRRRGYASATVVRFTHLAAERRCRIWGCFALRDGAGEAVYRSLGLKAVGMQVEWTKRCR